MNDGALNPFNNTQLIQTDTGNMQEFMQLKVNVIGGPVGILKMYSSIHHLRIQAVNLYNIL